MRIAVLGAGGFIGSHLIEHFITRGEHEVLGVDLSPAKLAGITGPNFRFQEGDIHALETDLYQRTDLVVDLIAYANPSVYVERPIDVFETNFEANLRVLKDCMANDCRVLQFSTSEIYGKAVDPAGTYGEDRTDLVYGPIPKQRWIYAATKQLLERLIYAHGLRGEIRYAIVRPFNILGPRFDYLVPAGETGGPRAFAHFMSALLSGGPIRLVDGGAVHRSFTDVRDACAAVQAIIDAPEASDRQAFNVGNPANHVTVREFAERMIAIAERITGTHPPNTIEDISGEEFYGRGFEDMDRQPPDVSKLKALGWQPSYDLDATLQYAMESYYADPEAVQRFQP